MPTSANDYAVACLEMLLNAALSDDLDIKRRTWKTPLRLPKRH